MEAGWEGGGREGGSSDSTRRRDAAIKSYEGQAGGGWDIGLPY